MFGVKVRGSPSSLSTYVRGQLLRCFLMTMTTASACSKVRCVFPSVLHAVFLTSLISLSYMPPDQGDLETLNCYVISCCTRKSCNLSLLQILLIHVAVALNVAALSETIRSGLIHLVMKAFSFLWNSSAVGVLVNSRCTALNLAPVKISIDAFSSLVLLPLFFSGPAKSTPTYWKG